MILTFFVESPLLPPLLIPSSAHTTCILWLGLVCLCATPFLPFPPEEALLPDFPEKTEKA